MLRSSGLAAEATGLLAWVCCGRGGEQSSGTEAQPPAGCAPKATPLSPVPGKSQEKQWLLVLLTVPESGGQRQLIQTALETNFSRNNNPLHNLLFFSVASHHKPLFYLQIAIHLHSFIKEQSNCSFKNLGCSLAVRCLLCFQNSSPAGTVQEIKILCLVKLLYFTLPPA